MAIDVTIEAWIDAAVAGAPNRERLGRRLEAISSQAELLRFLHRFLLFNDALAARVPFVAGLIHLTPGVFLEPDGGVEFCRQVNARIAAYVAEAAADEYLLVEGRDSVHQHLSQIFFKGVLAHYAVDPLGFDRHHPVPPILQGILAEVRRTFLSERDAESIFCALGFHVALEFFADQEFNQVDAYLNASHPDLVAALKRETANGQAYTWLAVHTVVEIGHYRAGIEALEAALQSYCEPRESATMAEMIKTGFRTFIDLQSRYYDAILCDIVPAATAAP